MSHTQQPLFGAAVAALFVTALATLGATMPAYAQDKPNKVVLRFADPFWEDRRIVRAAASLDLDEIAFVQTSEAALPTWWTQHPVRGPFLTGWAGGPRAQALGALSHSRRIDAAVESVSIALGVARARVRRSLLQAWHHDWSADPFARGAYSYQLAGGAHAGRELARPIESTLYFAGEATCAPPLNGTVEGALASGRRAADQILRDA